MNRCPVCNSARVRQVVGPAPKAEVCVLGDTGFMVTHQTDRSHTICDTCGHTWGRLATRCTGLLLEPVEQPAKPPSIWSVIYHTLFPANRDAK